MTDTVLYPSYWVRSKRLALRAEMILIVSARR